MHVRRPQSEPTGQHMTRNTGMELHRHLAYAPRSGAGSRL